MSITLREATPQDKDFLLKVYSSTREDELAAVPWSAEQREMFIKMQFVAQHSYYREHFPEADYKVILLDGEPVGRLYVQREEHAIRILDIALLSEHRNTGVGTVLLRELLSEAERAQKPLQIYVEVYNHSLRLFERLGFTRKAEAGINFLMEWQKPAGAQEAKELSSES
jgi:ribosomal protein S18 acetylase RimI-like enzyme